MDTIAQVDAFFAGKPEEWALFDALSRAVLARYPDTRLRVMKTCVAFDDPKPFLYVSFPPRKGLRGLFATISLREQTAHPRFYMVVPVSAGRYTVHLHIGHEAQIDDELLKLIARAHR